MAGDRVRKPEKKEPVTAVKVGEGVMDLQTMRDEIDYMMTVLLGKEDPPVDAGLLTLQEVAYGYFARASELYITLARAETAGTVIKGSATQKFRTMELRQFLEVARAAMELGSRRVTTAKLEMEQP